MSRTDLEDQVANSLNRQADSIEPPNLTASDLIARHSSPDSSGVPPTPLRRRPLLAAAAAVLVITGLAAVGTRLNAGPEPVSTAEPAPTAAPPTSTASDPPGPAPAPTPALRFGSPLIKFTADEVWVDQGGEVFRPVTGVEQFVEGIWRDSNGVDNPGIQPDPSDPRSSTSLDLTWTEHGHEMRINMYFESDGTDWWASEVSTYDPSAVPEPDWLRQEGEFFRSPIDTPFEGNVDLGPLHLRGLKLLALPTPEPCLNPTSPIALIHDAGFSANAVEGGEAFVTAIDTATCEPIAAERFDFTVSSDDAAFADAEFLPSDPGDAIGMRRLKFAISDTSPVSLHVTATDRQSGTTVAEADLAINQQDVTADPPHYRPPDTDETRPED